MYLVVIFDYCVEWCDVVVDFCIYCLVVEIGVDCIGEVGWGCVFG